MPGYHSGEDFGIVAKYLNKDPVASGDDYERITKKEIRELIWKQEHPQLGERLDDIYEEAADFVPRILETCGIDPQINRDTLRLIEVVVHIGYVVAIHFKQGFKRARPHQFDQRIYPSIPVPAHYSFPSGHSTQAHLVTNVLKDLFDTTNHLHTMGPHLSQIAKDVAENREWAGVHYYSDSQAGKCIAQELKEILLDRADTGVKELFDEAKNEWID